MLHKILEFIMLINQTGKTISRIDNSCTANSSKSSKDVLQALRVLCGKQDAYIALPSRLAMEKQKVNSSLTSEYVKLPLFCQRCHMQQTAWSVLNKYDALRESDKLPIVANHCLEKEHLLNKEDCEKQTPTIGHTKSTSCNVGSPNVIEISSDSDLDMELDGVIDEVMLGISETNDLTDNLASSSGNYSLISNAKLKQAQNTREPQRNNICNKNRQAFSPISTSLKRKRLESTNVEDDCSQRKMVVCKDKGSRVSEWNEKSCQSGKNKTTITAWEEDILADDNDDFLYQVIDLA